MGELIADFWNDHEYAFTPVPWVIVALFLFGCFDCQSDLVERRDLLSDLAAGNAVYGYVEAEGPTLTTPYFEREGVLAYSAWGEEEYESNDGSTSTRIIGQKQASVPFFLDPIKGSQWPAQTKAKTPSPGQTRVRVQASAVEVLYLDGGKGVGRRNRDTTWYERVLKPKAAVSALGYDKPRQTNAGRLLDGKVQIFHGSPRTWFEETSDSAGSDLFWAMVCWLVALFAMVWLVRWLGVWLHQFLGLKNLKLDTSETSIPLETLLPKLRSLDLRSALHPTLYTDATNRSFFLVLVSVVCGACGLFHIWLFSRMTPALASLTPFEGEGALERQWFVGLVVVVLVAAAVFVVKQVLWARGFVLAETLNGAVSDVALQLLVRLAPYAAPSASLSFVDESDATSARWWFALDLAHGEQLSFTAFVSSTDQHLELRLLRAGGTPHEVSFCWVNDFEAGLWVLEGQERASGVPFRDVSSSLAMDAASWLRGLGVGLSSRGALQAVTSERQLEVVRVSRAQPMRSPGVAPGPLALVARESFGLPPTGRGRLVWLNHNRLGVGYFVTAAALILGPLLLSATLWGGVALLGWDLGAESWYVVVAPLALAAPAMLWFEPSGISVRRRREVKVRHETLALRGRALRLGEIEVDLDQPFHLTLTREPSEGETTLLGLELRQGTARDPRRLRVSTPMRLTAAAEPIPELFNPGPVIESDVFARWLYPLVAQAAEAHGREVRWDVIAGG